jgi:hypothetical protein
LFSLPVFLFLFLAACGKTEKNNPNQPGLPDFCIQKQDDIHPPFVTMTVNPIKGKVPFVANLKAVARPGSEYTEIVRYQWDLNGDQIYDLETEQGQIEYEFIDPVRTTVSVQAFDNCDLSGYDLGNIDAKQNLPPIITEFYASPQAEGTSPMTTTLVVRAMDSDGVMIRCDWDLNNDGVFEESLIPAPPVSFLDFTLSHTFTRAGWYQIQARVMDDNGAMTYSNKITVKVSLAINLVFNRNYGGGTAQGLFLDINQAGNFADIFAAMGAGGMAIFTIPDLSNPGQMTLVERIAAAGYAQKVKKYGDVVYLVNRDAGLMVYYVPSPYYVIYEGQLAFCQLSDVEVAEYGGRVFVFVACAYPPRLDIFDVTKWYDDLYPNEAGLYSINYTPELYGGMAGEPLSVKWDPRGYIYLGVKYQGTVVYDFRYPHWGQSAPIIGLAPTLTLSYLNQQSRYNPISLDWADHPDGRRYLYMGGVCDSISAYHQSEVITYDVSDLTSLEGSLFVWGEDLSPVPIYPWQITATADLKYTFSAEKGDLNIPSTLYENGIELTDSQYEFYGSGIRIFDYDPGASYEFDYVRSYVSRFSNLKDDYLGPYLKSISARDNFVYAALGGWGMQIVDYSNPQYPRMAISAASDERLDPNNKGNDSVNEIEPYGDYSLIADGELGITVAKNNLAGGSIPVVPTMIRSYNASGKPRDMFFRRPELFLALGQGGVDIMNVTYSPEDPIILANVDTPGDSYGVWEDPGRNYLYIADRNIVIPDPDLTDEDALWVADRNNPSPETPSLVTKWPDDPSTIRGVSSVWGTEGRLYLKADRLYLLDISNPMAPALMGTIDDPSIQMIARGDFVYLLDFFSLKVLDCHYPQAVTVLAEYYDPDMTRSFQGFDVQGDYAYITDGMNLRVLDISYPEAVSEVSRIAISTEGDRIFSAIRVFDTYAVLGAGTVSLKAGLVLVDISNPRVLNLLANESDFAVEKVEAFKDDLSNNVYIYTLDGMANFSVFRISGLF